MSRGDVMMIDLPVPAGRPRREQHGRRPAIAVQSDDSTGLPTVMVVPLTSNLDALRYRHTIRVEPSARNGLSIPSVLLTFQLRAIDRIALLDTIGRLEDDVLRSLNRELLLMLNL
jgi:mRNA interferase MazF